MLLSLALLTVAVIAHANPEAPEMPRLSPLAMELAPGQWREYRYVGGPSDGATVRWTWLERVEREGKNFQWFETAMQSGEKRLISKVLIDRTNPDAVPARILMQANDEAVVEMPAAMRARSADIMQLEGTSPKKVESAAVEVPAGQYSTMVYVVEQNGVIQRTYVSEDLPGMVLIETPGFRMELVAAGDGGRTEISLPEAE